MNNSDRKEASRLTIEQELKQQIKEMDFSYQTSLQAGIAARTEVFTPEICVVCGEGDKYGIFDEDRATARSLGFFCRSCYAGVRAARKAEANRDEN